MVARITSFLKGLLALSEPTKVNNIFIRDTDKNSRFFCILSVGKTGLKFPRIQLQGLNIW